MALVTNKTMDALKNIGLNLYERRLWVALLSRGTSSAGELSEIANVPRSRAYDILQSLADKGFVVVQTSKPIRYVAISPEESLERSQKKMEEDIQEMQQKISEMKDSSAMTELSDIFTKGMKIISPEEMTGALRGKYSVSQQMHSMFKDASKKINILTTPEGLNEIFSTHYESLKKAKDKGVNIKIATTADERSSDAVKNLSGIAEIRNINSKETPLTGRFAVIDGKEIVFSLTDHKDVHATQDMAFWSRSEHAAGDVLEPLFNLVWERSKPVA